MEKINVTDFNLGLTIESGQFFHYTKFADFYFVNSSNRLFSVRQDKNKLFFDGADKQFIRNFFGLNDNYKKIVKTISKDKTVKTLTKKYKGLRLIRQDPWECMMSYVCSSAANIPKIQMNVRLMSQHFGTTARVGGYASYLFPQVGKINHLKKLKASKTGYRANYLYQINQMMNATKLKQLSRMNYQESKQFLTQLPGIGPKVADCISLFSLGHTQAFPVDVWIKRIVEKHYFKSKPQTTKTIQQFAQNKWGNSAGFAELFLYMDRN